MARTKKNTRYDNYSNTTKEFMLKVEEFLIKKYCSILPHWYGQLDLLASNYELFIMAKNKVQADGLMITNRFGGVDKHPLLTQIKDSNIQCFKIIQEFGLSPRSNSKIKEDGEDTDSEYLKTLME